MLILFERFLNPLLGMSITAAFVAIVVILLRAVLKNRAPKQVVCLLWLLVFARLLVPVMVESPFSLVPTDLENIVRTEQSDVQEPAAPTQPVENIGPVSTNAPVVEVPPATIPGNAVTQPVGPMQSQPVTDPVPSEAPSVIELPAEAPAYEPVWMPALAAVWLIGVAAMLIVGIGSHLKLRRRVYDAIRTADGVWEHPSLASPFILGLFRPKIYLPMGIEGSPRQFILHHERAHLRRLDHVVKPICWLALAIHWFNPLAWVAFMLMSRDIETACDESVIRQLGSEVKADYSATLLALATDKRFPAPSPLSFGEGDAKVRIKNVLKFKKPALWVTIAAVVVAVVAAVCLLTDPVTPKDPDLSAYTTQEAYPGLYFLEEESSSVGVRITAYRLEDNELVLVGGYEEHLANNFDVLIHPDGKEEVILSTKDVRAMFEDLLATACRELDPDWTPPGGNEEPGKDPVDVPADDPAPLSAVGELFLSALNDEIQIADPGLGMTGTLSELVAATAPTVEMSITEIAAVDLDGDGIEEVLLLLETPGTVYGTMILRCTGAGSQIYGYELWARAFNDIKTDGTFSFSGGVSDGGFGRISFTSGGYEVERITYSESTYPDSTVAYYVNKQPATRDEFLAACHNWQNSPGVTWVEYTPENAELLLRELGKGQESPPASFDFLASLPSELVNPDTLPADPEEYYLVAALPESHVYLYAKNRGEDSLLLWNGNFWWPLKGRIAHTPRMNLPRLYLMDENAQTTTVAAISEWASGTEVSVEQLVVYVMGEHQADSSYYTGLRQSIYDWSSIHEAFNSKKNTLVYDADTNSFTVFWNGRVYNSGELPQDMGQQFALEDGYTGSLFASGNIIKYTYVGGNRFTVTVLTAIEDWPLSPGVTGLDLNWTVEFNGEGFDLVGELSLGSAAEVNQTPSAAESENGVAELPNGWKLNDFTVAGFDKDGLGDFGYRATLSKDELKSLPKLLDLSEWQELTNPPEYGLTVRLVLSDSDAERFLYILDGVDGKAVIKLSDPDTSESFVYLASEECITYAKALAAVLKDRAS